MIRAPREAAPGSGVPCARLSAPSSHWKALEHDAHPGQHRRAFPPRIVTEDPHLAPVSPPLALQDLDRGGLPSTVAHHVNASLLRLLEVAAQRTVNETYGVNATSEERETFEEEVTFSIPPRTRCKVVFFWKELRQTGIVRFAGSGFDARIPYEVVRGLTFDQQQIDEQA